MKVHAGHAHSAEADPGARSGTIPAWSLTAEGPSMTTGSLRAPPPPPWRCSWGIVGRGAGARRPTGHGVAAVLVTCALLALVLTARADAMPTGVPVLGSGPPATGPAAAEAGSAARARLCRRSTTARTALRTLIASSNPPVSPRAAPAAASGAAAPAPAPAAGVGVEAPRGAACGVGPVSKCDSARCRRSLVTICARVPDTGSPRRRSSARICDIVIRSGSTVGAAGGAAGAPAAAVEVESVLATGGVLVLLAAVAAAARRVAASIAMACCVRASRRCIASSTRAIASRAAWASTVRPRSR